MHKQTSGTPSHRIPAPAARALSPALLHPQAQPDPRLLIFFITFTCPTFLRHIPVSSGHGRGWSAGDRVWGGCQAPTQSPAHIYVCPLWSLLQHHLNPNPSLGPSTPQRGFTLLRGASLGHKDTPSDDRGAGVLLNMSFLIATCQEEEPETVARIMGQK